MRHVLRAAGLCLALAVPAHAQDNRLFLLQDAPLSGNNGNTLFVDQSQARNSLVAGSTDGLSPAAQTGGGNSANIAIQGTGSVVTLSQTNSAPGSTGNSALLAILGTDTLTQLTQIGFGNSAELTLDGLGATGTISQDGELNAARLTVRGTGAEGALVQRGDRNTTDLTVTGTGTNVTYILEGNDLSNVGTGPQVFSNGGTVTITQTVIGTTRTP